MHRFYARDLHYDKTTDNQHAYPVLRVVLNVVIFLLLLLPSIYLCLWGYPTIRGYYCSDSSVRADYREPALGLAWVLALVFVIPILLIIAFEGWRMWRMERGTTFRAIDYKFGTRPVNRFLVRLYIFLGYFLLGAVFVLIIVDICRYTIGGLKPYFYAVCRPIDRYTSICRGNTVPVNASVIAERGAEYCANNSTDLKFARMSFPAWQAAFAFHNLVWVVIYIQARVYWTILAPVVRPVIQFLCICLAFCISFGVMHDRAGHWYDVLGGAIIGTLIALLGAFFLARLFYRRELPAALIQMHDETHYPNYQNGHDFHAVSTGGTTAMHTETTKHHEHHEEKKEKIAV